MKELILIALFIGIPFMLFALWTTVQAAWLAHYTATTQHPREIDYFADCLPVPARLQELDAQLVELGFVRLGSVRVRLGLHLKAIDEWQYRSADGTIFAEISQSTATERACAQFATVFADHAMVITRFPGGEFVMRPNYVSRYAANSLYAALEFHHAQVAKWQGERGMPCLTAAMTDITRYETLWRNTYRRIDYRRLTLVFYWLAFSRLLVTLSTGWSIQTVVGAAIHEWPLTAAPVVGIVGMLALEWLVVKQSEAQSHGQKYAVDGMKSKKYKKAKLSA